MALNRKAVITDIQKELTTTFIDINKAVGLITDTTVITELKRLYTTLEEVENDFTTSTEAYAMAKAYFDEGATTLYLVPVTGESSGSLTTIAVNPNDFLSITDGEFAIDIDTISQDVLALDFSLVGNVQDVADVISFGLVGATCTVGIANALVITSDTTGGTSTVTNLAAVGGGSGTDISALITEAFLTSSDKDIIGKLIELENDSDAGFNFIVVGMDKALSTTNQVVGGGAALTQFVFQKEYDLFVDSIDGAILSGSLPNDFATNKAFYDGLSGDDKVRVGNVNFFYTNIAADFPSFGVMGKLMSKDIGTQTVKFMKPKNSDAVPLLGSELQNILNYNGNVYTGTNERIGRAFMKEGTTLKDGDFTDTSLGSIWLKVQIEENIYNLLETKKVPINQNGFDELKTTVTPIFEQGIVQGIINGFGEGSFKFDGNVVASIITGGYDIQFSAGDIQNREIIGEYVYFSEEAAHFISNKIVIKTEA